MKKSHQNKPNNKTNQFKSNAIDNQNKFSKQEDQSLELISQGNLKEAEIILRELLNSGFHTHRVYGNLGAICLINRYIDESIDFLTKAINFDENYIEAYINLGIAHKIKGNIKEAIIAFEKSIELSPSTPTPYCNIGNIHKELGNIEKAIKFYKKSLSCKGNHFQTLNNLGLALLEKNSIGEALICFEKAIKLNPNNPAINYNFANALQQKENYPEAIYHYQIALKINKNYSEAYNNLGNIYQKTDDLNNAIIHYKNALKINSGYLEALQNLGNCLKEKGDFSSAIACFKKALSYESDNKKILFDLSLVQLLCGDYKNGWNNYQWRSQFDKLYANPPIKMWRGEQLNIDEPLLVISEQGLGDTLQYMRYIPYLRKQGINISFCAQEKLHNLIKISNIDKNPLTKNEGNNTLNGKWISLLSLPKYLQINPKNPIITSPYIFAKDELVKKWKNKLSKEKRPIIGINWQGNPALETTYPGRSIALNCFSTILKTNDISLLSLQKGYGSEQLSTCLFRDKFVKCQNEINSVWDFHENAAIITTLDLIITCDTSIAHLAGGMGKEVWLLLRDTPFWTWGLNKETTFWYPSMRLFRQKERHNWTEVIERVSNKLKKEIESKA